MSVFSDWLKRFRSSGAVSVPEPSEPPRRLIVGLGNPGAKYEQTRHNIGFRVLEVLADRWAGAWQADADLDGLFAHVEIHGRACGLLRPQTFMNRSGACLAAALRRWPELEPASDLLIVYDDLDLPPGRIRLRPSGGGGGHRGMGDILAHLESKAVPRLRFGVGHPGRSDAVLDWVLEPFSAAEEALLPAALTRAADAIELFVAEGIVPAMSRFNAEPRQDCQG